MDVRKPIFLIADANECLRGDIGRLLAEAFPGSELLQVSTGEDVLGFDSRHRPDAVVMDIILPGIGGLDVIERLKARRPEVKIVVFTRYDDIKSRERAASAGVSLFLGKDSPLPDVVNALRQALA